MKTTDTFFEQLLDLFEKHIEATDVNTENEYKERILGFIANHQDAEEDEELDEEETERIQDEYLDRNERSIRQGEMIDLWRKEI